VVDEDHSLLEDTNTSVAASPAGEAGRFRLLITLKALDRFFNLRNHPPRADGSSVFGAELRFEFVILERQIRRLRRQVRQLLEDVDTGSFAFRSYIESQWIGDDERDLLLERHSAQETPKESLLSLLKGLENLGRLVVEFRTANAVRTTGFQALAEQYRTLVVHNRFFNPLRRVVVPDACQLVNHPQLRRCVQRASSPELRRALGFLFIILCRNLEVLSWIRPNSSDLDEFTEAVPLLVLLRSEHRSLHLLLERDVARRFFSARPVQPDERALIDRADGLAFQLAMEKDKVFKKLLRGYDSCASLRELRGRVESCQQLLTVFFEAAVTELASVSDPDFSADSVFADAVERLEHSARLREDLWVFNEILNHVIATVVNESRSAEDKWEAYCRLLNFLTYFENLSFQWVRFCDYESFVGFFSEMRAVRRESLASLAECHDIASNFECFRIFIEMVGSHVSQRSELRGVRLDPEPAQATLQQFLS
jgi:hypothetical protein